MQIDPASKKYRFVGFPEVLWTDEYYTISFKGSIFHDCDLLLFKLYMD